MKTRYTSLVDGLNDFQKDILGKREKSNTFLTNDFIGYIYQDGVVPTGETKQLKSSIKTQSIYNKAIVRAYVPYARYQYNGVSKTGKKLNYSTKYAKNPQSEWNEEVWKSHKKEIADSFKAYLANRL